MLACTHSTGRRERQDFWPSPVNALAAVTSRMTWWMLRLILGPSLRYTTTPDGLEIPGWAEKSLPPSSAQFEMSRK